MEILNRLFIFILLLISCNYSDNVVDCGNGYIYVQEGKTINEIYKQIESNSDSITYSVISIPRVILSYDYNNEFIIASQVDIAPNSDYKAELNQISEEDSLNYWIIKSTIDSIYGPLSRIQFEDMRIKFKLPNTLQLSVK